MSSMLVPAYPLARNAAAAASTISRCLRSHRVSRTCSMATSRWNSTRQISPESSTVQSSSDYGRKSMSANQPERARPAAGRPAAAALPPLITRPLLVRFVSVIGAETSFFLPLSVVPLYVKSSSGSGAGAGLATAALLAAGVAGELVTPRVVSRAGYRLSLAAGLLLLGAPALALLWPVSLPVVVAVNIARGLGFAITTVAGGALTTLLIPAERRGEGLGLYGVAAGVPALVSLPAGVWAAGRWGYGPVFAVTAAAALLALVSVPGLPGGRPPGSQRADGVLAGLRNPRLLRLALVFAGSTVAAVVLSAAGMALLAAVHVPAVVVGGAACFGTGFGILQNATLAMMYARAPR